MYKAIARRKATEVFEAIGRRDIDAVLKDVAPNVHHTFPGDNALGGERHSRDAMRLWFERVFRLFPDLQLKVRRVAVKGPPWDMFVAIEWTDHGEAADGVTYENEGAHWIRLRRGKAVYIHAYTDPEKITTICNRLAESGVEEASAPPITS
jgi:ketosteroid isomerase-like protein